VPTQVEVTTQEAAKIMRVSRPFVVKMVDEASIHGRKVGKHRRVLLRDALAFRALW
jgi:excisionase family DNA binding protein